MATSAPDLQARATGVQFSDDRLIIDMADGRTLSVPLAWFPRLLNASPARRAHWRLIGRGVGIHWEELDEDISIPHLLGLPCE
jgi:hypothetical protein